MLSVIILHLEGKMHFLLIAFDGTDEHATQRRLAAREAHLNLGKQMFHNGKWLYGAAILDNEGKTIGSMVVCDFTSREELQKEWLDEDPYITGNVWEKIEIRRALVPSFFFGK
jgi:uncharacterized protein YciI